jgi:hypothetical protein
VASISTLGVAVDGGMAEYIKNMAGPGEGAFEKRCRYYYFVQGL